jgi:putative FmdB family regulatory protein
MPIYEFMCPSGTITEKCVKMGTEEIRCPKCHQKTKKIPSSFSFELKGGGWCADGYASITKKKNE